MKWWRYIFDERLPGWCRLFPACLSCPAYCYGKKLHEKEILGYDRKEETKKIIERISNAKGGIYMTQEDKQLLLKDLCARLPYGVKAQYNNKKEIFGNVEQIEAGGDIDLSYYDEETEKWKLCCTSIDNIKPYLRPMSSMTEEEEKVYHKLLQMSVTVVMPNMVRKEISYIVDLEDDGDGLNHLYDWFNENHFDYRGLIPMGLALEAKEGMYES